MNDIRKGKRKQSLRAEWQQMITNTTPQCAAIVVHWGLTFRTFGNSAAFERSFESNHRILYFTYVLKKTPESRTIISTHMKLKDEAC